MNPHELLANLLNGLDEIIPDNIGKELLIGSKPLTIKFGADPSAPDLHLGHMVVLNKLRILQNMGHSVIFLIGDFTAMIGDPTGKSKTRPALQPDQVKQNAVTYQEQVFKILDPAKTTVVYNSDWLGKLSAKDMIELAAKYTVARMLERDDFEKRFKRNIAISIHEFLYPLLQGYDSVHLENDIEIGGRDQKFNLLMGRYLQEQAGQKPQICITVPILEGMDGVQKMSKSLGNHIGVMDAPNDMFGKLMSIPDQLIIRYFSLLTTESLDRIKQIQAEMAAQTLNPKLAKEALALKIVSQLHSEAEAIAAKENFNNVFSNKQNPEDMQKISIPTVTPIRMDQLAVDHHMCSSKKEMQKLISQGAVYLDGLRIDDIFYTFTPQVDQVLKVGKRKFYRFK